jgi:hypothetical protein
MRNGVLLALLFVLVGAAHAEELPPTLAGFAAATPRETLLAAGIAIMMALGLASFFLLGRIGERTHVALALLAVLVGAFCLFALYGLAGREYPAAGAVVVLGLIGLFKLMNQFEIRRKSRRTGENQKA